MMLPTVTGTPTWNEGRAQRLLVSMLLSSIVVLASLAALRLPVAPDPMRLPRLLVSLSEAQQPVARVATDDVEEPPIRAAPAPAAPLAAMAASEATEDTAPRETISAAAADAITRHLDALAQAPSVNPVIDAKRRAAVGQYAPPTRLRARPIWENAEPDQLGRTLLRSGDCWRVIADPNVMRQYQFREFDQYIVTCSHADAPPRELPWVAGLRARYGYLAEPGG